MEQFPDGAHVRLRSRVHGGYLHADEDGAGVSLQRWRRGTMNAAWKVHRVLHDGSTNVLLLSAAYGRYLAATNDAAPPGHVGLRVELGDYDQDVDPILWKAVGSGEDGGYVLLRAVSNRLLRANGRYRLWLSGVSVDDVDNQSTMMHWKVETIPTSPNPPALQRTPHNWRRSFRGLFLLHDEPVQLQRTIRFVRADNHGNFPDNNWGTFQFQGRSVFELRAEVARREGNVFMFFRILMCVQGGRYGRFTPLLVDLPRNETDYLHSILLSKISLHGLPSRISEDKIVGMRILLMCAGDQYFFDIFSSCLEPIVDEVQHKNSWGEYLGNSFQQTVPDSCAIVSAAKCVEVQHRREYETFYGAATFPCQAAAPRKLRSLCRRQNIWTSRGAYVGDVLKVIKRMGGVKTTNAPPPAPYFLPLDSWEQHRWDSGDGLTADRIMELLDSRGPFVGTLWVCPWYKLFDAREDGNLVYRSGCARNEYLQTWSERCFGEYQVSIGLHSVVCFAYRVVDGEVHVLVLDNNTATGPERWIHYSELLEVHTVSVTKLDPPIHGRGLVYPESIYK